MARGKTRPFGTLFQRGDSWVFTVGIDGKRIWKSFDTREQAELFQSRLKQKRLLGDPIDELDPEAQKKRRTTLAEFAELWLPHIKQRVRWSTYVGYDSHVRTHLLPTLGDYPLERLTRERLAQFFSDWAAGGPDYKERVELARQREEERWQAEQLAARERDERLAELEARDPWYVDAPRRKVRIGNSRGTMQNGLTTLRSMLATAVEWGYLSTNPATKPPGSSRSTLLPRRDGIADEIRPLTSAEVEKLLAGLKGVPYLIVATAVSTGVRRGELFALRWCDVDVKARRLRVRRSVDRRGTFQEPKTRRSVREVGLPATLAAALREHRMASVFKSDDDLVFASSTGGPLDAANFCRREFVPALARAGVPRVRFHDLRHTFASLLIERGVHLKTISEQLGHASVAITGDRYSHLFDGAATDSADELEAAVFAFPATAVADSRGS